MLLTWPDDKAEKLNSLLFAEWDDKRTSVMVRQLQVLIGNLRNLASVVRPGRYFLWALQRVLRLVGADPHPQEIVHLTPEIHADLEWWRWLVGQAELMTVSLDMPLFFHVERAPLFEAQSDASGWGMGGCC